MRKLDLWVAFLCIGTMGICVCMPEFALAFDEFQTRVTNLTGSLVTVVLPALSILGLLYASALAVTGDGAAKGRIATVIGCSIVGFLAPVIIKWLQSVSGF